MSRILLGVSGGIAAYKALEFVRLATGAGHAVRVIQTPASRRFVGEASFAALTGAPVLVSEFERDPARGAFPDQPAPAHEPLSHLELVANADLFLIAPATANTIAKLAGGHADCLLTSSALAASCPVLVAPAMNNRMYEHPATQANLRTLAERGVRVIEPGSGRLASRGEEGVGRLAEPAALLAACEQALARALQGASQPSAPAPARAADATGQHGVGAAPGARGALSGTRVLVTAGGTREPIDSVRYIGNCSSGRMGLALAQSALDRGAEVTLIAANVALAAPAGAEVRRVVTAAELELECEREFPACEVLLMAAAVADFTPAAPAQGKLKKAGRSELELVLAPTADVLAGLGQRRRAGQTLVGFAAEHGQEAVQAARGKLAAKHLDALVVNDISRDDIGFDAQENEVTILTAANGSEIDEHHVPRASKTAVAEAVLDAVERLRGSG
ncbi:MAG TPA: bifunctional phosphopantothenoylcysteine decarboxylase/phosphopantothenate synthase [Solirubrobacteraceae bacterium]|nr:bifunctional phosphopantothenoylcysteine decarboxylase/phosphopantothenate synthase [Solirubrobacteraceae bacterium]